MGGSTLVVSLQGREGVVPRCTRAQISVLASHGEVSDKPVILTVQISAEKPLHSAGLRLVDRTESSSDKQKHSASFESPRPCSDLSCLIALGWAAADRQALLPLLAYGPATVLILPAFCIKRLGWHAPCFQCGGNIAVRSLSWLSVTRFKMKHFYTNETTPLLAWKGEEDCAAFSVAIWFKWHMFSMWPKHNMWCQYITFTQFTLNSCACLTGKVDAKTISWSGPWCLDLVKKFRPWCKFERFDFTISI